MTEAAAPRLLEALHDRARELAAATAADACVISRVLGDVLVIVTHVTTNSARLDLGQGFLISDYPVTQTVVSTGEPAQLTVEDDDADEAEVRLLRDLGFATLLMLPLELVGERWGLIELYRRSASHFTSKEIANAQALARVG
jgi:transcriptional regulator with GAF, ATPase, and Fis domain